MVNGEVMTNAVMPAFIFSSDDGSHTANPVCHRLCKTPIYEVIVSPTFATEIKFLAYLPKGILHLLLAE